MLNPFDQIQIPFTMPELFKGFGEGSGLLRVEETSLLLEYQVRDGVFGVIKTGIRQLRIPYSEMDGVTLHKRLTGRRLEIRTTTLTIPAAIPGNNRGSIFLSFRRRDKDRVDLAVSRMQLRIAEDKLAQIVEDESGAAS